MTHSFFAQMGGFAFDTDNSGEPYIPGSPRLHLTANGAAALAKLGHLPNVSKAHISDKSKVDSLGKALVIIQGGWLVVQCIARRAGHLPLTLLELNTLAHVVCALIMYALWWDKPLNIRDPLILSGDWVRPTTAAMWMFSRISTQRSRLGRNKEVVEPPEIERLYHFEQVKDPAGHLAQFSSRPSKRPHEVVINIDPPPQCDHNPGTFFCDDESQQFPSAADFFKTASSLSLSSLWITNSYLRPCKHVTVEDKVFTVATLPGPYDQPSSLVHLYGEQVLHPPGFGLRPSSRYFRERIYVDPPELGLGRVPGKRVTCRPLLQISVDKVKLERWHLAAQSIRAHPEIWKPLERRLADIQDSNGNLWTKSEFPARKCERNYVDPRIQNWAGNDLLWTNHHVASVIFFIVCVTIYGGIHAAAWNGDFPTEMERTLWRYATISISSSGILYAVGVLVKRAEHWCSSIERKGDVKESSDDGCAAFLVKILCMILNVVLYSVMAALTCLYIFVRCFLVVEPFISLRSLPPQVYQTPQWSQYIKHF
jgi:hypothetical protein